MTAGNMPRWTSPPPFSMPWAVPQAWCWRTQGPWGDLPVLLRGCSAGDPALRGVTVYSAHKQTFGLAVDK